MGGSTEDHDLGSCGNPGTPPPTSPPTLPPTAPLTSPPTAPPTAPPTSPPTTSPTVPPTTPPTPSPTAPPTSPPTAPPTSPPTVPPTVPPTPSPTAPPTSPSLPVSSSMRPMVWRAPRLTEEGDASGSVVAATAAVRSCARGNKATENPQKCVQRLFYPTVRKAPVGFRAEPSVCTSFFSRNYTVSNSASQPFIAGCDKGAKIDVV